MSEVPVEKMDVDESPQESTTPTEKTAEVQTSMVEDRAEEQLKTAFKSPASTTTSTKTAEVQTSMVKESAAASTTRTNKAAGVQTSMVEERAEEHCKTGVKRPAEGGVLGEPNPKRKATHFVPRCKRCAEMYKRSRSRTVFKKAVTDSSGSDVSIKPTYMDKLRPRPFVESCSKCTKTSLSRSEASMKMLNKKESPVAGPSGLPRKPTRPPTTDTSSD